MILRTRDIGLALITGFFANLYAASNAPASAYTVKDYGPIYASPSRFEDQSRIAAVRIGLNDEGQVTFGVKNLPPGPFHMNSRHETGGFAAYITDGTGVETRMPTPAWLSTSSLSSVHPVDVNRSGVVVGFAFNQSSTLGDDYLRAFLYRAGVEGAVPQAVPTPYNRGYSFAHGVNDAGTIVGGAYDENLGQIGFIYDGVTSRDLNTLIEPGSALRIETALAIGEGGQIVAYARNADVANNLDSLDGVHQVLLTPIPTPEPTTLVTFAVASLGVLIRRHIKREA